MILKGSLHVSSPIVKRKFHYSSAHIFRPNDSDVIGCWDDALRVAIPTELYLGQSGEPIPLLVAAFYMADW